MKKSVLVLMLLSFFSSQVLAANFSDAEVLFNLAEVQFHAELSPAGTVSQSEGEWYYRLYSNTGIAVGLNTDGNIYVADSTTTDPQLAGTLQSLLAIIGPGDKSDIINETGFENFSDGEEYTKDSWIQDGFDVPWVNGFDQSRVHIDTEQPHFGSASLRVTYPKNGVGISSSGAQAKLQFTGVGEVYVSYWLRFSDNFDWGGSSEGGKLPGLAGGDNCSGGSTCTGTNGFTARLMWRKGGKAVLYLYHLDKPGTYGEDFDLTADNLNITFAKGTWYNILQYIKINTVSNNTAQYDGEIKIWINGVEAISLTDIRFISDGTLVDNLYFSTFHGGSSSEWAPSETCYIWFDDLRIYNK